MQIKLKEIRQGPQREAPHISFSMTTKTTKPKSAVAYFAISRLNYFVHHTLWGCKEANNRDKQLEDLILLMKKVPHIFIRQLAP